jgi:truncated hemoglobin YjbI
MQHEMKWYESGAGSVMEQHGVQPFSSERKKLWFRCTPLSAAAAAISSRVLQLLLSKAAVTARTLNA